MQQEIAETEALRILGWLVGQEEILPVFLGASGLDEAGLRAGAGTPEMLAAVMDFVAMDDAWILAASEACGIAPERFAVIRSGLPGGDLPHWT